MCQDLISSFAEVRERSKRPHSITLTCILFSLNIRDKIRAAFEQLEGPIQNVLPQPPEELIQVGFSSSGSS